MELELKNQTRCAFCGQRIEEGEAVIKEDSETLTEFEVCRPCDEAVS